MRRIPAISLLLAIGLSLITPLFAAAQPGSDLPACCRRDGKHHCSMRDMDGEESGAPGVILKRAPARCAQYPSSKSAPIVREHVLALTLVVSGIEPQGNATGIFDGAEASSSIAAFDACRKRGPPAFFC